MTELKDMTGLKERAGALRLRGLLARWDEIADADWLPELIEHEERERSSRSLARRTAEAMLCRFSPLADFDWNWPRQCDRKAVNALMAADFAAEPANAVLVGPPGVGKTMIAANVASRALAAGATVRFENADKLLASLASIDDAALLERRLTRICRPKLLVLDELGYVGHDAREADILFHMISRRYRRRATIVTTIRPFAEWGQAFPGSACVAGLIDRLTHNARVVTIDADSWRLRETLGRADAP